MGRVGMWCSRTFQRDDNDCDESWVKVLVVVVGGEEALK